MFASRHIQTRPKPTPWCFRIILFMSVLALILFFLRPPGGDVMPSATALTASAVSRANDAVMMATDAVTISSNFINQYLSTKEPVVDDDDDDDDDSGAVPDDYADDQNEFEEGGSGDEDYAEDYGQDNSDDDDMGVQPVKSVPLTKAERELIGDDLDDAVLDYDYSETDDAGDQDDDVDDDDYADASKDDDNNYENEDDDDVDEEENDYTSGGGGDDDDDTDSAAASSADDYSNDDKNMPPPTSTIDLPAVDGPLFTCPDGRIGLHIIHLPLLIDQTMDTGASGVFLTSRMLLFKDFTLASLARQTVQTFVAYVSYNPNQDDALIKAGYVAMKKIMNNGAAYLYKSDNPAYIANKPDRVMAFPRLSSLLTDNEVVGKKEMKAVTLYITSTLDADDAVHVNAVKMIQEQACARVGPTSTDRVLSLRMGKKLNWFPHANTTYGVLATPSDSAQNREQLEAEMAAKPHLQSVAVDASLLLCELPVNCYTAAAAVAAAAKKGGGGGDEKLKSDLSAFGDAEDCEFEYDDEENVVELIPKGAAVVCGALHVRAPLIGDAASIPEDEEFTIDGLFEEQGFTSVPFDMDVMTQCGLSPGELSATNLLLASIYAEAPEVAAKSAVDVHSGWGSKADSAVDQHTDGDLEDDGFDNDADEEYQAR